jgi:hypothetical protein
MATKKPHYIRLKTLTLEEAFGLMKEAVRTQNKTTILDDVRVSVNPLDSLRLGTFLYRGIKCSHPGCLLRGAFFAVERPNSKSQINQFHLNLWAVNEFGQEILMTCDHIISRGLGGMNIIGNTQTMCSPHNSAKSVEEQRYLEALKKLEKRQLKNERVS